MTALPWPAWKSMTGVPEIQDLHRRHKRVDQGRQFEVRGEGQLELRQGREGMLAGLGVPRDPRGIVLACAFFAVGVLGLDALISTGDPLGFAYLLIAATGYLFVQTRLVPTALWLMIAGLGAWFATAGVTVNWIEFAIGMVLTGLSVVRPAEHRPHAVDQPSSNGSTRQAALESTPSESTSVPHVNESADSPGEEVSAVATAPAASIRIASFGHFRFEADGRDRSSELEDKAVLAFLFKYLMARQTLGDGKASRDAMAEELTPGYPRQAQRDRLRKQIYDLQNDVAPAFGSLIRSNRSHLWLDLASVDSDVGKLQSLAERVRKSASPISSQLCSDIQEFLEQTEGQEFLVGFEDLEQHVNKGRGTAGETVRNARIAVAEQRAELVRALAEYQDALGRPEASIVYLKSALESMQDRQDLARLLVTAYLKTGQTTRAAEVRRQFALAKE